MHWRKGRKKAWRKHKRRHWGLRRRFNFGFAFVALAAVALTTWMTLGAVFNAQQDLFQQSYESSSDNRRFSREHFDWNDPQFAAGREAFRQVTRTSFLAGLLSFLLASIAAGIFTRFLTRPLKALTDGAKRLEAGERGIRLNVPSSQDELRVLTEAFNGLVEGLERQESWRRNMVADIAHDLRTPLSVMRSEIEGMQDGVVTLDDSGLERLHGEVLLLSRLVDDLRTLSLVESGGLALRKQGVEVSTLLERTVDAFGTRATQVGSTVKITKLPENLGVSVDPEQMTRVLSNLVDNALRYASPGKVELGAKRVEDGVTLWVHDDGPGLEAGQLEQVFERFYRGDSSRTSRKEGSGLGLAIAKAITEAHGGRLEATNEPNGGARFSVHLESSRSVARDNM